MNYKCTRHAQTQIPIHESHTQTRAYNDKMWARNVAVLLQISEQGNRLESFAEAHFI